MKERFSTYKNHIKTGYKGCEIAKHFNSEPGKHPIFDPRSSSFDNYLKSQISVIVIDKCDLSDCNTTKEKREKIQILEGQWQTHLRTMTRYGGLNKRDDRKNANNKKARS